MHANALSLTAQTLYAELQELALAMSATENIGQMPGSVVRKTIKGLDYLYYQYRDLDGRTRQAYLGADDEATGGLIKTLNQRASMRDADLTRLNELGSAFIAAGGHAMNHAAFRVLKAFVDAGTLRPGQGCAVLIGTHAFSALGNLLGVRWASHMQTQDIDLAGEAGIALAINPPAVSVPDTLERLGMGFIPVPALDPRSPSTSFRVRGKELRLDLLTPETGKSKGGAIFVPALNSMAQPLRFLDYLLADVIPVVIPGRREQLLVNLPRPERFALHKLLVSESRQSTFATKALKDRLQAMQMLEVLLENHPDGIGEAKEDLVSRGRGWTDKFARALKKCAGDYPDVVNHIVNMM